MKKLLFILTACVALAAATRAESASYEKGSSFADALEKLSLIHISEPTRH